MSYRVELIPPARAEIRGLSAHVRGQALELVAALGEDPRPPRARRLYSATQLTLSRQRDIFRIWLAGRWRVVYEIDDAIQRVLILCLRRKEDTDYETAPSWMTESGTYHLPSELGAKVSDR